MEDLNLTEKEFRQCLGLHGYISSSDADSDSDSGSAGSGTDTNLDFEKLYEKYKPPPIKIDPNKHRIIEIGPSDDKPATSFERKFPKLEEIRRGFFDNVSRRTERSVDKLSKIQRQRDKRTCNTQTVEIKPQKTDENDNSGVGCKSSDFLGLSRSQKRNKRRRLCRMKRKYLLLAGYNDEVNFKNEKTKEETVSGLSMGQKKNRRKRLKKVNGVINPQIPEDVEYIIEIVVTEDVQKIINEENGRSMQEQYRNSEAREPQADLEDGIEFEEFIKHRLLYRGDDSHGIDFTTNFDETWTDSRKMTEIGVDGSPFNASTSRLKTQALKSQIDENDRSLAKDGSMKVSGLPTRQKNNREKPLREVNGVINPQIPEDVRDTIEIVVAEGAKKIINEENGRSTKEQYRNSVETREPQADLEDGVVKMKSLIKTLLFLSYLFYRNVKGY